MKERITSALMLSVIVGLCFYAAISLMASIVMQGNGFDLSEWHWMGLGGFLVLEGYVMTVCFMTVLE